MVGSPVQGDPQRCRSLGKTAGAAFRERLGIAMQPLPATPMRIGMANVGAMKSAAPLGSDLGMRCRGGSL